MRRRTYLSAVTASSLVAVGGCFRGDDSRSERTETDDDTSEDGDDNGETGTENSTEPDTQTDEDDNGTDQDDDGTDQDDDGTDQDDNGEGEGAVPTEFASIRTVEDRYDPDVRRFRAARTFQSDPFALEDGLTVVTFIHGRGFEFVVELLDEAGERAASIVDYDDFIEGAAAVPMTEGDYSLDVTNFGGYWDIRIVQPRTPAAAVQQLPVEASGTGSDVLGTVDIEGTATVTATHDGESDFRVICHDENATGMADSTVVFDEVGTFEGETTVQFDAITWVAVEADGSWAFEIR